MTPEDINEAESSNGTAACAVSRAEPCSALEAAEALIDFGPCRGSINPARWMELASAVCPHCILIENVDQAAGRIVLAELRRLQSLAAKWRTDAAYWEAQEVPGDHPEPGLVLEKWRAYAATFRDCADDISPQNATAQTPPDYGTQDHE